jgi:hypothetical protein
MYKLKVWTGPTLVGQIAEKCRQAGITVLIEGTEHIHVEMDGLTVGGAGWNVLVALVQKHGTDFGLRPKAL